VCLEFKWNLTIEPTPHADCLENLIVTQKVKKLSSFYGMRRFIIVFTTASHWSHVQNLIRNTYLKLCI
jgi:hypothetical protein